MISNIKTRIDKLQQNIAIRYLSKVHGLDQRTLERITELSSTIMDSKFSSYHHLRNIPEPIKHELSTEYILEILEVFENAINTELYTENEPDEFVSIASDLARFVKIVKSLDKKTANNLKHHMSVLRSETLNQNFITADGFSQEGEDLILKRLFPEKTAGFFVDIGAHHPTRFSNTFLFYRQGWRGINIDPRPEIMELFAKVRPEDINIETAIGGRTTAHTNAHYICFSEPAYNSIYFGDIDNAENVEKSEILDIIQIPVRTLDDVLEEHSSSFDHIDLLSIDVEGLEPQVLDGFSIDRYMPDVIVIEIRGFNLETPDSFEAYNFLTRHGYKLRSLLYNSLIFTQNSPQT